MTAVLTCAAVASAEPTRLTHTASVVIVTDAAILTQEVATRQRTSGRLHAVDVGVAAGAGADSSACNTHARQGCTYHLKKNSKCYHLDSHTIV